MADKTYAVFFSPDADEISAVVDWEGDGENSLERADGKWIPLEESSFDSLDGLAVDTMSEDIVSVFDKAEEENRAIHRSEALKFIVESERDQ